MESLIEKILYSEVLAKLVKSGRLQSDHRILVICGGSLDRDQLLAEHFSDVTISNLDTQYRDTLQPYRWSLQDAENLDFPDDAFDFSIVHMGLHHCFSPHRALLEMLRVARHGALVFENRDSFLLNVAKRLGYTVDYELEAVTANKFVAGGAGNGPIPNFVYRWTEAEVLKTVRSAYPSHPAQVEFFYRLRLPYDRLRGTSRPVQKAVLRVLGPILELLLKLAKKQSNEFGFFIEKQDVLHPWLERDAHGIRLSESYATAHHRVFRPPKES